jgi:hypothetical protein
LRISSGWFGWAIAAAVSRRRYRQGSNTFFITQSPC